MRDEFNTPEEAWLEAQYLDPEYRGRLLAAQEKNRQAFKDRITYFGGTTVESLAELGRSPIYALENVIDAGYQGWQNYTDEVAVKFGIAASLDAHKKFRFHNLPLVREGVSSLWAAQQVEGGTANRVYDRYPFLADAEKYVNERMPGAPGLVPAVIGGLFTALESKSGFSWIRENEDEARKVSADWNPAVLLLTPAAKLYTTKYAAANIMALEKHAPALIAAARDGQNMFMGAASQKLYGVDFTFEPYRDLVLAAQKNPRIVAETLFHLGARAPEVPSQYRAINVEKYRAPLFRHAGTLFSPTGNKMMDAAMEGVIKAYQKTGRLFLKGEGMYDTRFGSISHQKVKSLTHLSDAVRTSMNELGKAGKMDDKMANQVHRILSTVERIAPEVTEAGLDARRTVSSFKANYGQAVREGKIVHDPKAYAIAEKAVGQMALGWSPGMNWWPTLSVNPKFAVTGQLDVSAAGKPLKTFWNNPNIGHAESVTAPVMEKFVTHVATRNQRVAAVNALVEKADDTVARMGNLRTRMRHLYSIASKPENMNIPAYKRGKGQLLEAAGELAQAEARAVTSAQFTGGPDEAARQGISEAKDMLRITDMIFSADFKDKAQAKKMIEATGMGDAIRAGQGEQFMASLEDYVRAGIKTSRRAVRDLRRFRGTEDPLVALGKAGTQNPELGDVNAFGRALAGYDRVLGAVRTGQLFNPATVINNAFDTAVITPAMHSGRVDPQTIIASLRQGKPAELYTWMGEKVGKYADADIAALAQDIMPGGTRWYSKLAQTAGDAMTKGENIGRRLAWYQYYDEGMKNLTSTGMPVAAADKLMAVEATKFVDSVLVNYKNMSPIEKAVRRLFLYPVFNSTYAYNYAKLFASHGTETALAARVLSEYYNGSDDGMGGRSLVGGFEWNPIANLSPANMLLRAADASDAALDPDTRLSIAAIKTARAVFGGESPGLGMAFAKTGLDADLQTAGLTKWDNLMLPLVGFGPSTPMLALMGEKPLVAQERREQRMAQLAAVAAAREGRILSPDEAQRDGRLILVKSALASLGVPGLSYRGKTAEVLAQAEEIERQVKAAPPELQDSLKQVLVNRPGYEDLAPLVSGTPGAKARSLQRELGVDAANSAASRGIIGRFMDGFSGPPSGAPGAPGGPSPYQVSGSTEFARVPEEPLSLPQLPGEIRVRQDPMGSLVVTGAGLSEYGQAQASQVLNNTLRTRLQGRRTAETIHAIAFGSGPQVRQLIQAAAQSDPFYAQVYEQAAAYEAGEMNGANVPFENETFSIREARNAFGRFFRAEVQAADDPEAMAAKPLEFWRQKVLEKKDRLAGFGVSTPEAAKEFVDWTALTVARNRLPDGYGALFERQRLQRLSEQYPEMGKAIGNLQNAVTNPRKMESVLSEVRGMVSSGRLPQNFWELLDNTKSYRNLYENVGVAASYGDAQQVMGRLIVPGRDGRPVDVNHAALFEIALDPKFEGLRPYVQAARAGYYGGEISTAIERGISRLPTGARDLLDQQLPLDNGAIQTSFREATDLATGNYRGVTRDIMSRILPQGTAEQRVAAITAPPQEPANYVALPSSPVASASQLGTERTGWFVSAPGFSYQSPGQILQAGLEDHRNASVAYNAYQTAISEGRTEYADGSPVVPVAPPGSRTSYIGGRVQQQYANGSTMADIQFASQAIQAFNAATQGTYSDLQKTGDIEGGGDLGAAMYGLNNFTNALMNPINAPTFGAYALYVGIKSGLNFGKGQSSGPSAEQLANLRINQERLELQREQFEENKRQQTIRDIRTREGDLAKAFSAGRSATSPASRAAILSFQRRGSFASKVGMVDAIERELSSALTPRW